MTLHSEDEEDVMIFQREDQSKGGNTKFAHMAKQTKWCKSMQQDLPQKRDLFAVDKAGFEEICETALAFECSVVHEYEKSKTLEGKETRSSCSEDEEQQESVGDPVVYVIQRSTNGNCCHMVMVSLLPEYISYYQL